MIRAASLFACTLYFLILCHVLCLDSGYTIKRSRKPRLHKEYKHSSKEERKVDKDERKIDKKIFINTWAVRVVGDDFMAQKVANDYGFVYKGKVFGDVYEFIHRGVPKRRKRASFIKTLRLENDNRVRWTQQQASKVRVKRSNDQMFNDKYWDNQWYIHREEHGFKGHDMNILPVWKRGITGKGVVVSILDDGLEHTHPELKDNYDPKASYDYNNNDTDPMPMYTWKEDNRHGTRCAGEVAASANNSKCIVGIAYGAKIGGIRMLDGEITDLVEAQSLRHARDHIDIYSSSWGPEDDGKTVEGPGPLTKQALASGAKYGRNGKGSIFVWASGNGGAKKDYCNCDGYTNSIYTISVSTATSVGSQPWYLEHCASTLVSTYSSGMSQNHKRILTADLNGDCTDSHTGTSVAPPMVAGIVALALEVNPKLTWRDVQHLLVETSSLDRLKGKDFQLNGAGKKFSHSFGFGMVNGDKMVRLAEKWPTISEQHICTNKKEIQNFPHNRFNETTPLVLDINTTACHGTTQYIRYVEHVQVHTSLFHYRRGATEIFIKSPKGTVSWILKKRPRDTRGGEFNHWKFLSTHFWGENPVGKWTVSFLSKDPDGYGQGYLQDMKIIIYGTEHKPGERPNQGNTEEQSFNCHEQCLLTCVGPEPSQCDQCKSKYYSSKSRGKVCVEECPMKTYLKEGTSECLPCNALCLECSGANTTDCISCPSTSALLNGMCVANCPAELFKLKDIHKPMTYHCEHCDKRCTHCSVTAKNCTACHKGSTLHSTRCLATCASDEWLDEQKCRKCHTSCKTCSEGKQYNCTSCAKKIIGDNSDKFLYKFNQCVDSCPIGTYTEDTVMQHCLDCPKNCLRCSNNGRKCDICDVSHFHIAVDGKCVKECGDGYYVDYVRRVCEPCDSQCKSCVPGNPNACTSCEENYFLKDQNCISTEECRTTVYVNQTTGTCDICPVPCKFCDSPDYCTGCWLSYYLTPDKKCVDKCPPGSYPQASMQCKKCAAECSECNGPSRSDCTTCPKDRFLHNGKCLKKIPKGYYVENNVCQKCHHKCSECSGPTENDCVTCIGNLDMRENKCENPCPSQWLSKNDCQSCHPSCKSCYGPLETDCLQCSGNYSLNIDTKKCNKVCPRKFYQDEETLTCRPCHQSCGTCFGPHPDQCKSCPTKLNFFNNTCVLQCPSGWYSTFGAMCAKCSQRCKKCLYKYDLCTDCHTNQVWDNFKCFNTCLPKHFQDPANQRCYPCHESCLTCNGTAPNQCTSCNNEMSINGGMCLQGCLIGHYNSSLENTCLPCMKNCLMCQESESGKPMCTVCSNTTVLLPDGTCSDSCPLSTYKIDTNNVCLNCPGRNCLECSKYNGARCSRCKALHQLSNGLCKSTCSKGTYPNIGKEECSSCHRLCTACNGPTKHHCFQCKKKALTLLKRDKKISCVRECPSGYYKQENFCYPCDNDCQVCTSGKECEKCHQPFVLFNENCVSECPSGFYRDSIDDKCKSCEVYGNCTRCDHQQCLNCSNGTFMNVNKFCVENCDDGYYSFNKTCQSCDDNFPNCSICNSTNCVQCLDSFSLQGEFCMEDIPITFKPTTIQPTTETDIATALSDESERTTNGATFTTASKPNIASTTMGKMLISSTIIPITSVPTDLNSKSTTRIGDISVEFLGEDDTESFDEDSSLNPVAAKLSNIPVETIADDIDLVGNIGSAMSTSDDENIPSKISKKLVKDALYVLIKQNVKENINTNQKQVSAESKTKEEAENKLTYETSKPNSNETKTLLNTLTKENKNKTTKKYILTEPDTNLKKKMRMRRSVQEEESKEVDGNQHFKAFPQGMENLIAVIACLALLVVVVYVTWKTKSKTILKI